MHPHPVTHADLVTAEALRAVKTNVGDQPIRSLCNRVIDAYWDGEPLNTAVTEYVALCARDAGLTTATHGETK